MKPRVLVVVVCLALVLAALATPAYRLFSSGGVEPYIFGLPFFFGWTAAAVTVAFLIMVVFHLTRGEDAE